MKQTVYIELEGEAVAILDSLRELFPGSSYSALVGRALGLVQAIRPYLNQKTLTVVSSQGDNVHSISEDDLVDLVFEDKKAA